MKRLLVTLAFSLMVAVVSASGQVQTSSGLHDDWIDYQKTEMETATTAGDAMDTGLYVGYVMASADFMMAAGLLDMSKIASLAQLCAIVGKYLDDHPELWDRPAEGLVVEALEQAFPKSGG